MKHLDMKHLDLGIGMTKKPSNVAASLAIGAGRLFAKAGEPLEFANTGACSFKAYCTLGGMGDLQFTLEFSSKALKGSACIMRLVLTFPPLVRVFEEHKVVSAINSFLGSAAEEKGIRIFGGSQVRNFPRIIDGVGRYTTVALSYKVEVPED